MKISVGLLALVCPYVGVHWTASLVWSFLLLQQFSECLVRSIWTVFEMGRKLTYRGCFEASFLQNFSEHLATPLWNFHIALASSVSLNAVQSYSSADTITAWKNWRFILSDKWGFCRIDNLSIIVCFIYGYMYITFCRWDIAIKVWELCLRIAIKFIYIHDVEAKYGIIFKMFF